jgi:DNA-binding NarL/FixJ family response regulator
VRIVLAEDQFLLREGLVRLLDSYGVEVVAALTRGDEVLEAVTRHHPDLSLLDIRLPPGFSDEGLRAAIEVRRRWAGHPVVLLSQHVEQLYVEELLADDHGAVGYLLKDRVFDEEQFIGALHTVAGGGTVLDPQVVEQLMDRQRRKGVLDRLTPRETEVLGLMAEGDANPLISRKLTVTEKAVAKHINSILTKLDLPPSTDASRRVLAVLTYLRS